MYKHGGGSQQTVCFSKQHNSKTEKGRASFEPVIPMFERFKTVHASNSIATVMVVVMIIITIAVMLVMMIIIIIILII
jgi:hypothetical protein